MIDHFDLLAPVYDWFFGPPDLERWRDLLRLPTEGRLLDAGGGTGRVSVHLRPWVGRLVISDVAPVMLTQAQTKGNLQPLQAQSERLSFPDESFERLMVVDALHHFDNQAAAIGDLLRVLKPGGRLVIEEPDINRFAVKLVALAEKLALMKSHFYAATEIAQIVAGYGLTAQIEKDGLFAAWVIVDK
jgi:demethylmenaquinone methyltransferase/2-methoxy-6-polyprenyl-1,4-benzoquinol methylase